MASRMLTLEFSWSSTCTPRSFSVLHSSNGTDVFASLYNVHPILEGFLPTSYSQHLAFVRVKWQLPCPRPVHQGVILLECVAAVQIICPTVHLGVISKQLYGALYHVRHIIRLCTGQTEVARVLYHGVYYLGHLSMGMPFHSQRHVVFFLLETTLITHGSCHICDRS